MSFKFNLLKGYSSCLMLVCLLVSSFSTSEVIAQSELEDEMVVASVVDEDGQPFFSREETIVIDARQEVLASYSNNVLKPSIPSLLFLPAEHQLLQAAKSSFLARLPTEEELNAAGTNDDQVSAIRTVSLGGILYYSDENWVIWLNSQRITPNALPVEVMDLVVSNEYINIKWFDRQTNKIYPIRLRPNQTFNLDARMFLPG